MRKLGLMILGSIIFLSCSTNRDEIESANTTEMNVVFEMDGCVIYYYDFADAGSVEVRNDFENLIVTFRANENYLLTQSNLDVANNFSNFPLAGKGVLNPNKMEYQESFALGMNEYQFIVPIDGLDNELSIATYANFTSTTGDFTGWAGDIHVKQGNWSYFEYQISDFPFYAGQDNTRTITLSEATALPSWDEVRKVYANMLDEGVDRSEWYAYDPSISDIINDFNSRQNKLGDYTTTYTLGDGECSDSAVLTLRVVPD